MHYCYNNSPMLMVENNRKLIIFLKRYAEKNNEETLTYISTFRNSQKHKRREYVILSVMIFNSFKYIIYYILYKGIYLHFFCIIKYESVKE